MTIPTGSAQLPTEPSSDLDTCDRCEKPGHIHVGHEQEYGYDGLCDSCLDALAEAKQNGWPIP